MKQSEVYLSGGKNEHGRHVTTVGVVYQGSICCLLPKAWGHRMPTLKEAFELINGPIPMFSVKLICKATGHVSYLMHRDRMKWTLRTARKHQGDILDGNTGINPSEYVVAVEEA